MQDKENNNWIILDQLGNIYKIYANMAVATFFLSLNQSWMKQLNYVKEAHLFVKASVVFVTIFSDVYENPRRKNFINPSCPKYPKIIQIKNDIIFIFILLWDSFRPSFLLSPPYLGLRQQGLRLFFANSRLSSLPFP